MLKCKDINVNFLLKYKEIISDFLLKYKDFSILVVAAPQSDFLYAPDRFIVIPAYVAKSVLFHISFLQLF